MLPESDEMGIRIGQPLYSVAEEDPSMIYPEPDSGLPQRLRYTDGNTNRPECAGDYGKYDLR